MQAFLDAAKNGDIERLRQFVNDNVDLEYRDDDGYTALIWATREGKTRCVRLLLDANADVHAEDHTGYTALIWAAATGHIQCARLLINANADIEATTDGNDTALIWAARNGHAECLQLLFDAKADVNAEIGDGSTVLTLAAASHHIESVQRLIDLRADLEVGGEESETASASMGDTESVQLRFDASASLDASTSLDAADHSASTPQMHTVDVGRDYASLKEARGLQIRGYMHERGDMSDEQLQQRLKDTANPPIHPCNTTTTSSDVRETPSQTSSHPAHATTERHTAHHSSTTASLAPAPTQEPGVSPGEQKHSAAASTRTTVGNHPAANEGPAVASTATPPVKQNGNPRAQHGYGKKGVKWAFPPAQVVDSVHSSSKRSLSESWPSSSGQSGQCERRHKSKRARQAEQTVTEHAVKEEGEYPVAAQRDDLNTLEQCSVAAARSAITLLSDLITPLRAAFAPIRELVVPTDPALASLRTFVLRLDTVLATTIGSLQQPTTPDVIDNAEVQRMSVDLLCSIATILGASQEFAASGGLSVAHLRDPIVGILSATATAKGVLLNIVGGYATLNQLHIDLLISIAGARGQLRAIIVGQHIEEQLRDVCMRLFSTIVTILERFSMMSLGSATAASLQTLLTQLHTATAETLGSPHFGSSVDADARHLRTLVVELHTTVAAALGRLMHTFDVSHTATTPGGGHASSVQLQELAHDASSAGRSNE